VTQLRFAGAEFAKHCSMGQWHSWT
jgi:hypothetical protein